MLCQICPSELTVGGGRRDPNPIKTEEIACSETEEQGEELKVFLLPQTWIGSLVYSALRLNLSNIPIAGWKPHSTYTVMVSVLLCTVGKTVMQNTSEADGNVASKHQK